MMSKYHYHIWKDELENLAHCKTDFASRASQTLLNYDADALASWNPYDDEELLYAIRGARLSLMSMILVDLDGSWPDDESNPDNTRKGWLLALVLEARQMLIDAILGVPESVTHSHNGKSTQQLSIGGFSRSNISFYFNIPARVYEDFHVPVPGLNNKDSLCVDYWLTLERERLLASATNVQLQLPEKGVNLTEYISKCYREKLAEAKAVGQDHSCKDEDVHEKNIDYLDKILNFLHLIEQMQPLAARSYTELARTCFTLASVEEMPKWARS